jgi:Flp pilus assembly protein TadD
VNLKVEDSQTPEPARLPVELKLGQNRLGGSLALPEPAEQSPPESGSADFAPLSNAHPITLTVGVQVIELLEPEPPRIADTYVLETLTASPALPVVTTELDLSSPPAEPVAEPSPAPDFSEPLADISIEPRFVAESPIQVEELPHAAPAAPHPALVADIQVPDRKPAATIIAPPPELDPADTLFKIGDSLRDAGRLDESIVLYRQALSLRPDLSGAHGSLGCVLQQKGRFEEAIAAYSHALALSPASPQICNNMGSALRAIGRFDEAIACYRKALALRQEFSEAWYNMGIALQDQGNLAEAIDAYQRAIALRPADTEAHCRLGSALHSNGKLEEAIISYRHALSLRPDFAASQFNLANALRDQGKREEAIAAYRQTLAIKSDFVEAQNNLLDLAFPQ